MPVKLKSFSTSIYYRICGVQMKLFQDGVKGMSFEYFHPSGVLVSRVAKPPEFVPIHNIQNITPENIEDLQKVLGVAPKEEAQVFAVVEDGPIPENPHPAAQGVKDFEKVPKENVEFAKKKRKRRTKAEMEAARSAAS
jgi:hypothetical protein